jgi:phosphohistidine swiveling domain-containing protein
MLSKVGQSQHYKNRKTIMKIFKEKDMDFWTRELKLPLFWITDTNNNMFSNNILLFYKNNIIHIYILKKEIEKMSQRGYMFFKIKKNINDYEKQSKNILEKINKLIDDFNKCDVKKIDNNKLKEFYLFFLRTLNSYSEVYIKTEPFFLKKIEKEENKYKNTIEKLGKIRFQLRKESEPIFFVFFGLLLKEISKRFEAKVSELYFYTYGEMIALFNGKKVRKNVINNRQKGYLLFVCRKKQEIVTGKKFINIFKKFNNYKIIKQKEISGVIAMKGKVRGRVKLVIHNRRNINKKILEFKNKEILVTEMTRPGTILACKKASAIITDEGGITSHAAIISREFKIPCIVGTKNATQILKDGDLVEVDAYNGIIKIIK